MYIIASIATLALGLYTSDSRADSCNCNAFNPLTATTTTGYAVSGSATGAGGVGVYGDATAGLGVWGATADGVGVKGTTTSARNDVENIGVWGIGSSSSLSSTGVEGDASSTNGMGVFGKSTGTNGVGVSGYSAQNNGVMGQSASSGNSGVYGYNSSGAGLGVAGRISPYGSGYAIYGDNWSSSGWAGNFNGRVWVGLGLDVNGTCVSGDCSSDERLKTNIKPLVGSLEAVAALRPVTFEWRNPRPLDRPAGTQTGFIAQEVEKVEPTWVQTDPDGFKTINRDALPMLLVDSIKTLKAQNDELRARVATLEASRRPVSQNFSLMGSVGLLVVGGVFLASRRRKP
jgi:hypothetical protein